MTTTLPDAHITEPFLTALREIVGEENLITAEEERMVYECDGYVVEKKMPDVVVFPRTAEQVGAPTRIVETVIAVNDARKRRMAQRIRQACGGSVAGKTLAVLGLTFKPNTDDMRDAPSLAILPALQHDGARIRAFDPEGLAEARKLMPDLHYCTDAYEAMDGADALVILTEWNEFRSLDLRQIRERLRQPVVIDLRNIYNPADMADAGFVYHSIGRPSATGSDRRRR